MYAEMINISEPCILDRIYQEYGAAETDGFPGWVCALGTAEKTRGFPM